MSLIRKIANGIADLVVRYASPGSKEWAEAMQAELVSIESDWRALAWACSGMRVLFAIRPAPLRTLDDLNEAAQKHAEKRRHAVNNGWLIKNLPLVVLSTYIFRLFVDLHGRHVVSSAVQLSGWLLLIPLTYLNTHEPNVPDRYDPDGMVRFYVNELRTNSKFSLPFCLFVAGGLAVMAGLEMAPPHCWTRLLPLLVLPVLAFPLVTRHNNRKRLAQIESSFGSTLHE